VVDALVGLVLFASVLSMSLAAGATALKVAAQARAVERARNELIARLEAAPATAGETSGTSGDIDWTVTVEAADPSQAKDLCRVEVELTPAKGAPVSLATLKPCRSEG
jgi:hypothetical protein